MALAISEDEILKYAVKNGILNLPYVQNKIIMHKREELLKEHPYKIWEGKDGKWRTYLPDKEKGRVLKKRTTKEAINELIIEYWDKAEKELNPTMRSVFDEWTQEKLRYRASSRGTYDRYEADFVKFIEKSELNNIPIADITVEMLETFIKTTIADHKLTSKCYSNIRTLVSGIFKYAKKKKYTQLSITCFFGDLEISSKMFAKTIKNDEEQVFLEDEIPKVIEYLKSNPTIENLGILLEFQTGVRIGELAALKPTDIVGNRLHIQRTEIKYKDEFTRKYIFEVREYPKTDAGVRYIILTSKTMDTINRIKQLNPNGEYLFMKNGKRIRASALNERIIKACKKLEITRKSSHKIRKTYGTLLVDSNVDDSLIIKQMGHTNIKTTKEFYYFSNKSRENQTKQIDEAIKF